MKQTKINLLTYKSDYRKIEKYFSFMRYFILFFSIIFLVVVFCFYFLVGSKNQKINNLLDRKKRLLESIQDKKDNEAKIIFIQKKYQVLKDFLTGDAYFLPYYNLLNSALKPASEAASLETIQIDKQRQVDFTVSFKQFKELTNFLKFVESQEFLKQFENLSLKSFSAQSGGKDVEGKYVLSFYGQFTKINEIED